VGVSAAVPRLSAEVVEYTIGNRRILHTAYVDAVPGAITALVGVSGCGKTTLFEIMLGRKKAYAQVRFDGEFVPHPRFGTLARRGLFYLPDKPWLALPLPVSWHLAAAARPGGEDWHAVASELGIEDLLGSTVSALSGGEKRLVALADRGVAVLFADHDVSSIRLTADRLFAMENGATRLVPEFKSDTTGRWYHAWGNQ